jgi:hypothetical protein
MIQTNRQIGTRGKKFFVESFHTGGEVFSTQTSEAKKKVNFNLSSSVSSRRTSSFSMDEESMRIARNVNNMTVIAPSNPYANT